MQYIAVVAFNTVTDLLCRKHSFVYYLSRAVRLGDVLNSSDGLRPPDGHVFVNFTSRIWEDYLLMQDCTLVYCDLENVCSLLLLPKDARIHQEFLKNIYDRSFDWE